MLMILFIKKFKLIWWQKGQFSNLQVRGVNFESIENWLEKSTTFIILPISFHTATDKFMNPYWNNRQRSCVQTLIIDFHLIIYMRLALFVFAIAGLSINHPRWVVNSSYKSITKRLFLKINNKKKDLQSIYNCQFQLTTALNVMTAYVRGSNIPTLKCVPDLTRFNFIWYQKLPYGKALLVPQWNNSTTFDTFQHLINRKHCFRIFRNTTLNILQFNTITIF